MNHSDVIKKIASVCIKVFFYLALPACAFALAACAAFSPLSLGGYVTFGILVKIASVAASIGLGWVSFKFHKDYNLLKQDNILATFFEKLNLPVYDQNKERLKIGRLATTPLLEQFTDSTPVQQLWSKCYCTPIYLIKFHDARKTYISYFAKRNTANLGSPSIFAEWYCKTHEYYSNGSSTPDYNKFWTSSNFNKNFSRLETLVNRKHLRMTDSGVIKEFTLG